MRELECCNLLECALNEYCRHSRLLELWIFQALAYAHSYIINEADLLLYSAIDFLKYLSVGIM